ncbi:MAG: class I SAM-dependent methyltransferase, partial [Pirellulales bacterium]
MSNPLRSVEEIFVRLNSPLPQAQPEQLAAIARVRGMQPCAGELAAVLEIGCGSGSNLLPLAERYPRGRLLGLDVSPSKIAAAQRAAAEAGLGNVEFRCAPIASIAGESFDYIIAPDVYSWIDEATRDALLVLCQRNLAPQGMAYVNYNANPGWRLHDVMGALMRFEARGATTAAGQLAAGRNLLEFARATLPTGDDGYGALVVATAESILRQPDAALIRNYLQGPSHAEYYPEFEARARRHELQVLGDAGVGIRVTDFLSAADERRLESLTDDPAEKERMRDIVHNTAHRQSVLCRADVPLDFALGAWRLRNLYLEGRIETKDRPVSIDTTDSSTFVSHDGYSMTTAVPSVKAAITHLGSRWPRRIEFAALVAYVGERAAAAGLPLSAQDV